MALARGLRLRDDHAFEQRKATISAVLDGMGDVRVNDTGKRATPRQLEFELDSPRTPLAAQASFRYVEWWMSDGRGWHLGKYQYDYFDRLTHGRLAYHRHDLAQSPDVLHLHCIPSGQPTAVSHYRAYEVDLFEAHEESAGLYLGDRAIECAGLRPLRITEEGADA